MRSTKAGSGLGVIVDRETPASPKVSWEKFVYVFSGKRHGRERKKPKGKGNLGEKGAKGPQASTLEGFI